MRKNQLLKDFKVLLDQFNFDQTQIIQLSRNEIGVLTRLSKYLIDIREANKTKKLSYIDLIKNDMNKLDILRSQLKELNKEIKGIKSSEFN